MTRHLAWISITLLLAACSGSSETPDAGAADGGARDGAAVDATGDATADAGADLPVIPTSRFAVGDSNTTTDSESIANAVDVDLHGNSYLAGWYRTQLTLGGKTLKTSGWDGAFAAKLDPKGKVLWLTGATGIGGYGFRYMAVGPKGNTFVAGWFDGKATFDSTSLSTSTAALFVAKLDGSGKYVWVRQFDFASASGGPDPCTVWDMDVDSSGNPVIAGAFYGDLKLGTTSLAPPVPGLVASFVIKLDASGKPLWGRTVSGAGKFASSCHAVAVDGKEVLIAGLMAYGDATFDGTTLKLKDKGTGGGNGDGGDLFVARLDDKGKYLWAVSAGSTTATGSGTRGEGLAVDASGNVYVTGRYSGTVAFGGTSLTANPVVGSPYVARLDAKGKFEWAASVSMGGTARDVAVGPAGKVHVVGSFTGSATFGKRTINAQGTDVFVAWLDDKGSFLDAVRGGGKGQDEGRAVAADHAGNTYVAGTYRDTATFDTTTLPSPQGSFAALIWKLAGN